MGVADGGAAVDGVLLAFDGAGVVFETAQCVWDAEIGLLNPAEHFLVEAGLEGFCRFEVGVGVRVFGFEVGEDARIFFVAEPGVVVDAAVGVDYVLDGFAESERGLKSGGTGFGGGGGLGGEMNRGRVGVWRHFSKRPFKTKAPASESGRYISQEYDCWWNTLLGHINRRWVGITACWYCLIEWVGFGRKSGSFASALKRLH